MRNFTLSLATAATLACVAGPAGAASPATTSFQVTATVISTCTVSATDLAFGDYSPVATTATDGSSTITVRCTLATPYGIGLDAGAAPGATVEARKMTKGAETLTYSLYQDVGHAVVWGNTFGTDTVSASGTGLPQLYSVYGQIPAGQNVNVGAYSDTISVTVNF